MYAAIEHASWTRSGDAVDGASAVHALRTGGVDKMIGNAVSWVVDSYQGLVPLTQIPMPSAGAELYCTLYVAGAADPDALAAALGDMAQGHVTQGAAWVRTPLLNMAVHAESRHLPLSDTQDDFTLWRHFVEVNAADDAITLQAFLAALARVVAALRARGLRVVAACDFEERLEAAVQAILAGEGEQ